MIDDLFATVQPEVKAPVAADIPDVVPLTAVERFIALVGHHPGAPKPPAQPLTGADIQRQCRWCAGRGCLVCDSAKDAEYKRQFPHGPPCLATFHTNDPEDMQLARKALDSAAALGKDVDTILCSLREATEQQTRLHGAGREEIP